jgi:RNA polymerase-binding protein DksA
MTTNDTADRPNRPGLQSDQRWAKAIVRLLEEQNETYFTLTGVERNDRELRDSWDVRELESESSTTEVERRRRERMFVRLRAIDEAIARLNDGVYGLCLECGEPISPKRLEADPAAARCVACQSLVESGRTPPSL